MDGLASRSDTTIMESEPAPPYLPESLKARSPQQPSSLPERVQDEERRLIIAIDYGTTNTGIAVATPLGKRAVLSDISVIQDWGRVNEQKIPSVISYASSSNGERQWGADISPQAIAMVHTKLALDIVDAKAELGLILQMLDGMKGLDFEHIRNSTASSKYPRETPEEIVGDYLEKVIDHFYNSGMAALHPDIDAKALFNFPVDVVMTTPATWGYKAKNSTFRALTRAGLRKPNLPDLRNVFIVSEPEAAAVYTARYYQEEYGQSLKKGDCFILCDAGGGTVDVVSYKVKQSAPFEIERITEPTGEKCGSIFINLAFKRWLKKQLGETNYRKLDPLSNGLVHEIRSHDAEGAQMREILRKFEEHKAAFEKGSPAVQMELPAPLNNLTSGTTVRAGELTIPSKDMASFFESCADPILKLVEFQILEIKAKLKRRPKKVFLVGGFANSPYLRESIKGSFDLMDNIQLWVPDTSWTAVVRGATVFGIEKPGSESLQSITACSRYYGVSVDVFYSEVVHHPRPSQRDPLTNIEMAKGQLTWLIKKGDMILSNRVKQPKATFDLNFPINCDRKGVLPIWAYDGNDDDLPAELADAEGELFKFHEIHYDLNDEDLTRHGSEGLRQPYYSAAVTLTLRLTPPKIQVELKYKEKIIYAMTMNEPPVTDLE